MLPLAPELPVLLKAALASQKASPLLPPIIDATQDGTYDASLAKEGGDTAPAMCFGDVAPRPLALASRCSSSGVMVAPSCAWSDKLGLYPTRDFRRGDIVLRAESPSHKWLPGGNVASNNHLLQVVLVQPFRSGRQMVCVGDDRFPWSHVQSSMGTPYDANLCVQLTSGPMTDDFCYFDVWKYFSR